MMDSAEYDNEPVPASSDKRTFCIAVFCVEGGKGGLLPTVALLFCR
jgi:hypothetical protein